MRLQHYGWEIAIEEMVESHFRTRFFFRNQTMRLYAISDQWDPGMHPMDFTDPMSRREIPPIRINGVAPSIEVHRIREMAPVSFMQIDAQPSMVEMEITKLEDLCPFTVCQHRTKEVLVSQADMSVVDHLEKVLEMQKDKQKELRAKARKADRLKDQHEGDLIMQVVKVA